MPNHKHQPSLLRRDTCRICHKPASKHGPLWLRVLHKVAEVVLVGVFIAALVGFGLIALGCVG